MVAKQSIAYDKWIGGAFISDLRKEFGTAIRTMLLNEKKKRGDVEFPPHERIVRLPRRVVNGVHRMRRNAIYDRWCNGGTLKEVGEVFGISGTRVRGIVMGVHKERRFGPEQGGATDARN